MERKSIARKHLTIDERIEIQQCLSNGMTFKAIGMHIGKDQTTISKEVKKHIQTHIPLLCTDQSAACPALLRTPYVCNPCPKRRSCRLPRQMYVAKVAQSEYEDLLVEARSGIPLGREEFYEVDRVVSNGIKRGQHLYHILQTNCLGVSKSTVYRHLKQGYLSVGAIDFPRVVKFKPRRMRPAAYVPKALKTGRTYDDFLGYIGDNEITSWVEMDTLIGRVGGKAILTFDFTFCNFMFGLLLENKTAHEVAEKITALKAKLSDAGIRFGHLIPTALTNKRRVHLLREGVGLVKRYLALPYECVQLTKLVAAPLTDCDVINAQQSVKQLFRGRFVYVCAVD